jgi:hypothetical protein
MTTFVANGLLGIDNEIDKAQHTPQVSFSMNGLLGFSNESPSEETMTMTTMEALPGTAAMLVSHRHTYDGLVDIPQLTTNELITSGGSPGLLPN